MMKRLQTSSETLQRSVQVCQSRLIAFTFHVPLFRTLINIQSHCFNSPVPDPLKTTASIPHRIKSQSVWTPGSFVTHQMQIVLIAAHSWDKIS